MERDVIENFISWLLPSFFIYFHPKPFPPLFLVVVIESRSTASGQKKQLRHWCQSTEATQRVCVCAKIAGRSTSVFEWVMAEGVSSVTCCRQNKVVALFKFQFSSSSSSSEAPMPLCTHMQRTQVVLYSTYAHAIYAPTYNHRERRGEKSRYLGRRARDTRTTERSGNEQVESGGLWEKKRNLSPSFQLLLVWMKIFGEPKNDAKHAERRMEKGTKQWRSKKKGERNGLAGNVIFVSAFPLFRACKKNQNRELFSPVLASSLLCRE